MRTKTLSHFISCLEVLTLGNQLLDLILGVLAHGAEPLALRCTLRLCL